MNEHFSAYVGSPDFRKWGSRCINATIVGRCTYIQVIYVYLWEQYFFKLKKYITKKGYRINHYINVWLKSECQLSDHNGDLSSQDVNMQTVLFFYYDQWRKKKERIAREPSSPETWCKIHCSAEHQLEGKQRSDGAPDGSLLFFIHELAPHSFTWFLRRW